MKFRTKGGNFEVMFDTGQTWTAAVQGEDQGWVHISKAEGEAGIQSIELTIDPNLAEESRSASIMILARTVGKRIKINQLGTKDERAKASRSVLAYMAAENSLNSYATQDLAEMIEGMKGVTEDNKLLVYVDDVKFPRMYEIAPNEIGVPDTIRVVDYPIEYDSSDPATLVMALDYMKENYEAEEYGLVMWSHGEGWTPGTTRYIGVDNNQNTTSNSGLKMGIDQLRDAVHQTVGNLEFLFFDACFMMTAEVAYELRD
ncbi:MAG: hypothetical protein HUJ99_00900, partial [Bacteroidaceae bacterium]|nr:hypothetical protein [Bacteroidaceae bacterium]